MPKIEIRDVREVACPETLCQAIVCSDCSAPTGNRFYVCPRCEAELCEACIWRHEKGDC